MRDTIGRGPWTRFRHVGGAVAALALLAGISGCAAGHEAPTTSSATTTEESATPMPASETSPLDEQGLKKIRESGVMTLDLRKKQLTLDELGLSGEAVVPDVAPGKEITLRLLGPKGETEVRTDHVRFLVYGGEKQVSVVTYFVPSDSAKQMTDQLQKAAKTFGFDPKRVESWTKGLTGSGSAGKGRQETNFPPGDALGIPVQYSPTYNGPGHGNVIVAEIDVADGWDDPSGSATPSN